MPLLFEMYVERDSPIHRLDPRVKLLWFLCVMICAAIVNSAVPASIVLLWIIGVAASARLPLKRLLLLAQALVYMIVVCVLMWPLFVKSGSVLFKWDWLVVTNNGILVGIGIGFRIASMILASAVIFMTTTQKELIESLRTLKIPEHFVFASVLALRYIPSLMGEWNAIAEAEACRSPSRGRGPVATIRKVFAMRSHAIPIMHRTAKMTTELSLALDSKGFNPERRPTPYLELTTRNSDRAFAAVSILFVSVYVALRFLLMPQQMWIEIY